MQQTVIALQGVGKRFRLRGPGRTLKAAALDLLRGRSGASGFDALLDVTFDVAQGETLGIIGANGAGKSTLLGLIAGTLQPSSGTIRTAGTISPLLELGAGFHPDLSGRDNVYLYGAILGLPRRHVRARFDAIVDFAGLGEFIDQPVRHYSSGMYVRLGFAVAVEVDPDILLVDEVLAVGDAAFQRKCLDRMQRFRDAGKTLLIISHDLHAVRAVSNRILLLDRGRVLGLGAPDAVVADYQRLTQSERTGGGQRREWGTGEVLLGEPVLAQADGAPAAIFDADRGLRVTIPYRAARPIDDPVFGFGISDGAGRLVHGSNTQLAGLRVPRIEGQGTVILELPRLGLAGGVYLLSLSVHSADHTVNYHRLDHAVPFTVANPRTFDGCAELASAWRLP